MNIALISFEYPIDTGWGGIATYVQQAAEMLHEAGYYVEVFCGTPKKDYWVDTPGFRVNLVNYSKRNAFYKDVVKVFAERHNIIGFDVLEVPEFATDAKLITERFPEIAVVVKTHSPLFLNRQLNTSEWSVYAKIRHIIGSMVRRERPILPYFYNYKKDPEYWEARKADLISSPSRSLENIVKNKWKLPEDKFKRVPYPFEPNTDMLNISPSDGEVQNIGFIGRLEVRKGITDLIDAIPMLVDKYPHLNFYLIGQSRQAPNRVQTMDEYLKKKLGDYVSTVHFVGKIPYQELPEKLSNLDVTVFPSLWENFPNVCLEAMSAARAVVGSKYGGMRDMITHLENGYLIKPGDPKKIVEGIEYYIQNPEKVTLFGTKARRRILEAYSRDEILPQQIALYQMAIARNQEAA
ncbi:MAG: glycosyltransferase family 4 protein [Bacteroidota bacterium]